MSLSPQLIALAVRALPPGEIRRRYERELNSELHELSGRQQAIFVANILLTCRSLRGALIDAGTYRGEGNTMITFPGKPLRCRLGLKHHWVRQSIEDSNEQIVLCSLCGKESPGRLPGAGSVGATGGFTGFGGGGL